MAGGKGGGGGHENQALDALAAQMTKQGAQLYGAASPYFSPSLSQSFANAGYQNGKFQPIQNQGWFRNAEEQTAQGFKQNADQLQYQLNRMGLGRSPAGAGAMEALARGAQSDLGNFYRVQAPEVQNQRILQALGMAAPGIGSTLGYQGGALQGYNQSAQNALAMRGQNTALLGSAFGALGQAAPYLF